MARKKVRVAIVGLGFGAEFIPIYQRHPNAEMYAICRRNADEMNKIGDAFGVEKRYASLDDVLADPKVDAVHINSPIPDHAPQSVKVLQAGKHCACTVPMGTTVDECRQVVEAQRASGKNYMMMETVVYSREYLFVKQLCDSGELGRVQFLRGSHQQDMDGWPSYWPGLPPMWYATHCVSPCLALLGKHAESVVCHGSGRIREELIHHYNSPFAVESATFKIRDTDVVAEVTRTLFDVARQYRESFDVTGSKKSFEWQQVEDERPHIHTKNSTEHPVAEADIPQPVKIPDFAGRLPRSIRKFTKKGVYDMKETQHLSFTQGGGHGGSHPHLAHEFLMSIVEGRPAMPDAATSANWTMTGICAHESAMKGGTRVEIPQF